MLHKNIRVFDLIKTTVIVVLVFFCLSAIGYAQTKDVNALIKELKDKDPNVRGKAARQLGNLKDFIAIEPLIVALKDEDKYVRMYAVRALGKIVIPQLNYLFPHERQKVMNHISAAIEDKEHIVRLEALKVLQKIFESH